MKNLLIVPTRTRPQKAEEFYQAFVEHTSDQTDLCFAIDEDDAHNYEVRRPDVIWEVNPRMGMNGTLNHVATKYCDVYDYISFMGDDHRIRTYDWDLIMTQGAEPLRVAYGNDLLQSENLPTAVLLDAEIVRLLGFMAPTGLRHLYLDNFWLELGRKLGTLTYYPDIIIEHMHYTAGKSDADELYLEVNSEKMYSDDATEWGRYLIEDFDSDLGKLRG